MSLPRDIDSIMKDKNNNINQIFPSTSPSTALISNIANQDILSDDECLCNFCQADYILSCFGIFIPLKLTNINFEFTGFLPNNSTNFYPKLK